MYRQGQLLTTLQHNFVLSHGALGDMICSLPALIKARMCVSPQMVMRVYVGSWQIDLVKHLLAPYGEFQVLALESFPVKAEDRAKWNGGPTSANYAIKNTHTRNRVHMVDYAFAFLTDSKPESMAERSYPVLAPLGPRVIAEPYVVFPVGATSDNKLFRASVMVPILQWCVDNGYKPVIVGTKTSHTKVDAGGKLQPIMLRDQADMIPASLLFECRDMREKTTLLELRDLLGHAAAVVGVDGGTLHLAGTTDTNIIYASGTTLPKHRFIARFGDPSHKIRYVGPRDLECAGCQSNWLMTQFDFRFCAYDDNLCMERLHSDDFIAGLKELGL